MAMIPDTDGKLVSGPGPYLANLCKSLLQSIIKTQDDDLNAP